MCKHSVVAKTSPSVPGQMLEVGKSGTSHNSQVYGTFTDKSAAPAGGTTACLVCVPDETRLTLFATPAQQHEHKIGPREIVTMIDKGDFDQDFLRTDKGHDIPLVDLVGSKTYVGVMEDPAADTVTRSDTAASTGPAPREHHLIEAGG